MTDETTETTETAQATETTGTSHAIDNAPTDLYDPAWPAYIAAHPAVPRGVGADAPEPAPEPEPSPDPDPEPTPEPKPEPEPSPEPTDWRAAITSDDGKKFAESSPDVDHLVTRAITLQKQVSTAIVPPGKDAKPEEIAAYHKKIGVPESPDKYVFEMPEGREPTENETAFQKAAGEKFHSINVSAEQAAELNSWWNDLIAANNEALAEADKKYAEDGEAALRKQWPGPEYDKNKAYADRAAAVMFGDQLETVKHMEDKSGRYVLDHPAMLRAMATVGREMAEGGLVPPISDSDKTELDGQLAGIRERIAKAQGEGNSKEANRLFQEEQALITKTQGNQGVVGARGRVA